MKISCIAVDDEPFALQQMKAYIEKTPFLELVRDFNDPTEAITFLSENKVDLIFMDIQMPDISGMSIIKSLENSPFVIFTTAFSEYAVEGFKVSAVDYLLKPITYSDFLMAANKAKARIELMSRKPVDEQNTKNFLFVKSDYKTIRIEFGELKYIEGMSEYVKIFANDPKPVITLASMKSLEEQLPADNFMRVHRSFIVNLDKITAIERNRIIISNQTYIPVGEQYKDRFQEFVRTNFLT
jgi:DNA-binding LytR/AlgR family response regulator